MKIFVQQISTGLFLKAAKDWVEPLSEARIFGTSISAVAYCVGHLSSLARDIRLMARSENPESDLYFYPFGRDPVRELERENLRKQLAENRELRERSRVLLKAIDAVAAETKDRKKQVPFKRAGTKEVRRPSA
jgi:hypothetical protein